MAAADKARFYLEQCIPELQEYEKKKLFAKDEISAITRRRSDFEHRINATGCTPVDYARYVTYELNLDALRRARMKRLNQRGSAARMHHGQRRIFFILDRATRKFPGDLGLWMQYLEYARKEKASNVLAKALAAVLKLHPAKSELWIWAANHAMMTNADMTEARSHMQRGLRFCKKERRLWIEYAKLELVFIAKVLARRKLLGIDGPAPKDGGENDADGDENMLALPAITAEDLDPTLKSDRSLDGMALENVATNPALNGAIPLAIYDSAMKELNDVSLAAEFFDLFASFHQLACCRNLLEHIAQSFCASSAPEALWLHVKLPTANVSPTDPVFPSALGEMLQNMAVAVEKVESQYAWRLCTMFAEHLLPVYQTAELDPALKKVVYASVVKYCQRGEQQDGEAPPARLYVVWTRVLGSREGEKAAASAAAVARRGLERHPEDAELRKLLSKVEKS